MSQDQNPKYVQAQKDGKAPLEYLVTTVFEGDAHVHKHGALKYGKFNWRRDPIAASTYVAAMMRHLKAWTEGQDIDPDSGRNHLYHLRACCAVVLDADMHGKMIDDRLEIGVPKAGEPIEIEVYAATASPRDEVTEPALSTTVTEAERLAAAEIEKSLAWNSDLDFIPGCKCTVCVNTALVKKVRNAPVQS